MKSEKKAAAKFFEEEPKRSKRLPEHKNIIAASHKQARTHETRKKDRIQIAKKAIEALERTAS